MNSDMSFIIAKALLKYLGFLIAITMHQAAVAIIARKRGDYSSTTSSFATINPLTHISILGTVILPFLSILFNWQIILGWPKQFQIETRYFKNPRKDINIVYLSAIGVNFLIAVVCMIALRFLPLELIILTPNLDLSNLSILMYFMLASIGIINILIGALFLLPIPGLPGWNLLINNVSYNTGRKLQEKAFLISILAFGIIIFQFFSFYFAIFYYLFRLGSNTIVGF